VATDQRGFAIAEATAASEAFLTSSIRGVLPVRSIDGQLVGDGQPGPLCRRLMQDYAARYLDRRSSASPSSSSSSSSPT
jgi:branched-subunit amino acid aminotransferase/4-amino-4-deoxychorismate lyase